MLKRLFLILLLASCLISTNSHAENEKDWMRFHHEQLKELYKEHKKIYKMISKMCIKELGYEAYREIILSPDEEEKDETN